MQIQVGIITVSDRASRGLYDDLGGPALKQAAEHDPDLVVLDVMLPDMDGFTVTRKLRGSGRLLSVRPALRRPELHLHRQRLDPLLARHGHLSLPRLWLRGLLRTLRARRRLHAAGGGR